MREARITAITMIMILMVSFAFAGQNKVVAQTDYEDAMFTSSEDGVSASMDLSIQYAAVQPSFSIYEQTSDTEYSVFPDHADLRAGIVIETNIFSVPRGSLYMLVSESHNFRADEHGENTDILYSDAIREKRFTLPET